MRVLKFLLAPVLGAERNGVISMDKLEKARDHLDTCLAYTHENVTAYRDAAEAKLKEQREELDRFEPVSNVGFPDEKYPYYIKKEPK